MSNNNNNRLFAAKKPCNICGGLISWDQTIRESIPTKLPLNLDRTVHDRASCNAVKLAHPGLPTENVANIPIPVPQKQTTFDDSEHVKEAKITASLRTEAIAQGHEENMQSAEKTRESLEDLMVSIDKLTEVNAEASEDSKQSIYHLSEEVRQTREELHEMNTNIKTLANIITAYIEQK